MAHSEAHGATAPHEDTEQRLSPHWPAVPVGATRPSEGPRPAQAVSLTPSETATPPGIPSAPAGLPGVDAADGGSHPGSPAGLGRGPGRASEGILAPMPLPHKPAR